MTDPKHPLEDGLTPKDYDEYGDVPDSAENADDDKPDVPDSLALYGLPPAGATGHACRPREVARA